MPRTRVVGAYRTFIKERQLMAGFVAPQLADWKCWDAAPEHVAILKANSGMDPASQFAIVNYLKRATEAVAAAQ